MISCNNISKNSMILICVILRQQQHVTDGRMDRHFNDCSWPCWCTDNNYYIVWYV